jgi:hypothetical protein
VANKFVAQNRNRVLGTVNQKEMCSTIQASNVLPKTNPQKATGTTLISKATQNYKIKEWINYRYQQWSGFTNKRISGLKFYFTINMSISKVQASLLL